MEPPIPGPPAWYDWGGARWYRNNPGYYIDVTGDGRRLHIAIWEEANRQPLPDGLIVHHVDHNKGNNNPSNLIATTRADHNRHHGKGATRDAAARARIRAGVLESWARREPRRFTCERCGKEFDTLSSRTGVRFCGRLCQSRSRREHKAELRVWERETRSCDQCGGQFVPKDRRSRFCSRACANEHLRLQRQAERAG
jgi:hypothetical protein